MLELTFTFDKGEFKSSMSSTGLGTWLVKAGEHTFRLTRAHGTWRLQLQSFSHNQPGFKVKVGKKVIGTVNAKTPIGTIFVHPCKRVVQKIKPSQILASEEKTKKEKSSETMLVKTRRPRRNFWEQPVQEELVYESFVVNPKNPSLTYYACKGDISFGYISQQHMLHLPLFGWNVKWVIQGEMIRWNMATSSPIGVLHPLLYPWFIGHAKARHIKLLKKNHKTLVGFDVADTDAISQKAIAFANKADVVIVPSNYSKSTYVKSGLQTRIEVVPHGLSHLYNNPKQALPDIPHNGIKILFFDMHSPFRKGADIVSKAMAKIFKLKPNARFIVKTCRSNAYKLPRTHLITEILSQENLIHLYDACDILLAPSRGGGFEKNVLEGMARGLVVITSDWPAIQEYAADHVLTAKSEGKVKLFAGNPVHVGSGVNPSIKDCVKKLQYAIDNLDGLKKKADNIAGEIRSKYSWEKATKKIVEYIK